MHELIKEALLKLNLFPFFFCVQLLGHVNRKENRNAYSYKFMDSNLAARSKDKRPPRKKKKSLI